MRGGGFGYIKVRPGRGRAIRMALEDHQSRTASCTEVTAPGLSAPVEVIRDLWGVPHVRAADEADALFANGWVNAADRLWQMDAARRRAIGRFAEWAGPDAAPLDVLARRLDVAGVSQRDHAALSPEGASMCQRYADGVNAFIERGELPPEYALLGEVPEPWEPWHSVAVMRQRGLLMGSIWFKLWRAAALKAVGPEAIRLLRYDDGGVERFVTPQSAQGRRWIASLEDLAPAIEALAGLAAADATVAGSNNWAVDGRHTASGKPLVAGDPHRVFEIPGMYAQLHLACPEFDVLGLSVPGVPLFPHFGHSARVAWCVTHAFADIHDLYVERFEGGDTYVTKDGPREATVREETVRVRGGEDIAVRCVATGHGPIIAGAPEDGFAIALRSAQLEPTDHALDCLPKMAKAADVETFYEATRGWGVIDHNLVAADVDGHIGVSVRAMVPRRDRRNGWLPVPGWTGGHEWDGMIPFEAMPREIDPPAGRIVTANNRPVPDDWPDYICTDCHPTTRADRIVERLEARSGLEVDDMVEILRDTRSARALELIDLICAAEARDAGAARLQDALKGWDGRMDPGLLAPTVYILVRQEMTRILARRSGLDATAGDPLTSVPLGIPAVNQLWWTLPILVRSGDETLLGGAGWGDVAAEALATVAGRGETLEPWGAAHRPLFVHPLGARFAEAVAPTSDPTGGDGDCVAAIGSYPTGGTAATYGPIARYVFDVADWDRSRWVVFHGVAGAPGDPHYSSQNPHWARGELIPAPYSEAAVAAHAAERVTLKPEAR